MIRQKISIEVDWDLEKKDKKIFRAVKEAILNECLKSFTAIYQAKIGDSDEVLLTVFNPTKEQAKGMAHFRRQMVALKKKRPK